MGLYNDVEYSSSNFLSNLTTLIDKNIQVRRDNNIFRYIFSITLKYTTNVLLRKQIINRLNKNGVVVIF